MTNRLSSAIYFAGVGAIAILCGSIWISARLSAQDASQTKSASLHLDFMEPVAGIFSQAAVVRAGGVKTIYLSGVQGQGDTLIAQSKSALETIEEAAHFAGRQEGRHRQADGLCSQPGRRQRLLRLWKSTEGSLGRFPPSGMHDGRCYIVGCAWRKEARGDLRDGNCERLNGGPLTALAPSIDHGRSPGRKKSRLLRGTSSLGLHAGARC
jgi:hypothetical protein